MSLLKFTKMQGAGNDYIYINTFDEEVSNHPALSNLPELAIKLSNRNFGIGADGIVLIHPTDKADLEMRMFNADGSESEMCGNAIRCVGKYGYDYGLVGGEKTITVNTGDGIKTLEMTAGTDGTIETVTVDMGVPELRAEKIPSTLTGEKVLDHEFDFRIFKQTGSLVSMGNPHFVTFELPDELGIAKMTDSLTRFEVYSFKPTGPIIENAIYFPNRINFELVHVLSRTEVNQRTWERGSGETLACGTGACAAVVAGILTKRLDSKVLVHLRGGDLNIRWAGEGNSVFMTGDATEVFTGTIDPTLIPVRE